MTSIQRRLLMVAAALAIAYPISERLIHASVVGATADPMFEYIGTRGPFKGTMVDGKWRSGATAASFHPGEAVAWDSDNEVVPGTTVSTEWTLWCNSRPVYAEDFHIRANEIRSGWATRGMVLPMEAKGACEIHRHGQFISKDGKRIEDREFPMIRFTVEPAP